VRIIRQGRPCMHDMCSCCDTNNDYFRPGDQVGAAGAQAAGAAGAAAVAGRHVQPKALHLLDCASPLRDNMMMPVPRLHAPDVGAAGRNAERVNQTHSNTVTTHIMVQDSERKLKFRRLHV